MKGFKNKYFFVGIAVALVAGGVGCQKHKEFSGAEIAEAQDGFGLTSEFVATSNLVDLGVDETIGFSAAFNQRVSWELVVEGLNSGATMTFAGIGEYFVAENVIFDGRSTSERFFMSDEYVVAKLMVSGADTVFTIDSIETVRAYSYHRKEYNGVKHIVVDNFETAGGYKYSPVSLAVSTDALDSDVDFKGGENVVIEGNRSFKMSGQDDNNNGWVGGMNSENLVDFYLFSSENQLLIDSGINPEDLYFNIYIYGTGIESTAVQLKVYEYDHKTFMQGDTVEAPLASREDMRFAIYQAGEQGPPIAKTPYDQSINDGWIFDISIDWTGWKMVSIPYSSFRAANEFGAGAAGDRIKESWRICGMAVSLLAFPSTGVYVETYIDQLVITQGGKFQK
jgi:hypothetical protein